MFNLFMILSNMFMTLSSSDEGGDIVAIGLLVFLAGPVFYTITYARYRNQGTRHFHEKETPVQMNDLQVYDTFVEQETKQTSKKISGENSTVVTGSLVTNKKSALSKTLGVNLDDPKHVLK